MTVGSTLLTVVLAAIGVAAFATDPLVFGVTIAVALVTLAVLARSLRESVNPPFTPPTLEMLLGIPDATPPQASDLTDEPESVEAASGALTDTSPLVNV